MLDTSKSENRMDLGNQLGIPRNTLVSIEMEALQMSSELQQRRAALEKMVNYAFKKGFLIKLLKALDNLGVNPLIKPHADEVNSIRDLVASITGIHNTLVDFVCVYVCTCVLSEGQLVTEKMLIHVGAYPQ